MNDLVSIIMPSYNTGRYIAESIESVIAQTYTNWELLIVDDCSTDETDAVVARYLADTRIRYMHNPTNSGAAVSRNRALREAKGRWMAFLDSDDLWMPDKLSRQITFMEQGGYHFSYTRYQIIDASSEPLGVEVGGPKRISRRGMYNYCWPGCLTVMYDAQVIGLIQIEDIKKNNDYAIWLKICQKADCMLHPELLSSYRKRDGSISNHSYQSLIVWHYRLYRQCDGRTPIASLYFTIKNIVWGIYKKLRYNRRMA